MQSASARLEPSDRHRRRCVSFRYAAVCDFVHSSDGALAAYQITVLMSLYIPYRASFPDPLVPALALIKST